MMAERERFLSGVTVLDLTTFLSGPFATQLLADMGAQVVKVESPNGDSSRTIPPHFVAEDSVYFHAINRSKQSVQLDLKHDMGREAFERMCGGADVVIENFRPGVMERLGLGLDRLRGINPHLVTCSLSGFGSDSPHQDVPAYDAMIQAWTGGMSLTGHPGAPPARMGIPIGDLAAGMYAALAIAGACTLRERTGEGSHVDVAMFDAQIALLGYQAAYYLHSGEVPGPQGAGHVSIPTYRAFRCGDDDYLMVTANTESMWHGLCRALDLKELIEDARFLNESDRLSNAEALWARLEPAFEAEGSDTLLERIRAEGVPVAPVNDVAQALADEHVAVRGLVQRMERDGEEVEVPGNPVRSPGMRAASQATFPPRLGADTVEVLHRLGGLNSETVRELQAAGAAGPFRRGQG